MRLRFELLCLMKVAASEDQWKHEMCRHDWIVVLHTSACMCWHRPLKTGVEGEIRLWRGSLLPCCLSVLSSNSAAVSSSLVFCCKATCVSSCLFASINWICAFQMIQYSQEQIKLRSYWRQYSWAAVSVGLNAFSQTVMEVHFKIKRGGQVLLWTQ